MNIANLRDNHPKLIAHLESADYRQDYIDCFKREVKNILMLAESGKVSCYADVYREHEQTGCSQGFLRTKRNVIGAIERFDLHGTYPDGKYHATLFPKGSYNQLCPEYKAIINCYADVAKKQGKTDSSIRSESNNASVFLLTMQQLGVLHLSDVTESNVLAYFVNAGGENIRSYACKHAVSAVLQACIPTYPDSERVIAFLPCLRNSRKNIQYLTAEEIDAVKSALSDLTLTLTLRDRAIGTLALYTGLRECDIAGMKLDSIDLVKDLLYIRQQKTDAPLTLPLSAIVGNAIWDYMQQERPNTACEYLFISQNRPFGRIQGGSSMWVVSSRILKAAGIRQNKEDRKGFHLFRHHLATKLLGKGVPRPVISGIIGHNAPESLNAYLSADFPHLKECAIDIANFPVAQEVFAI